MKKLIILTLTLGVLGHGAPAAVAACHGVNDPYEGGRYASRLLVYKPGYWINTKGPLYHPWGKAQEKTPLHHTRKLYPERMVLGCPKATLEQSLTLGHEGYVVVGPQDCFRTGKGPDVIIHEPRTDMNTNETFNVYVTPDPDGKGPWYKIASNILVSSANNFLELNLEGIKSEKGYPIEEFFWVKVEDANSKAVYSHEYFSGFELSSVKFMHQCSVPIGSLKTKLKWAASRPATGEQTEKTKTDARKSSARKVNAREKSNIDTTDRADQMNGREKPT